ncbi:hypothetical protein [Gilliamella sp. W8128]|uniref:hypothetical protein n=1 Tax=Gilliamella sp. W8128 TaxID=2751010 RepID=UPI0018DBD7B0|nr:hypothetical protein [Gilliamella sp. W8128]MBI0155480.1 hypothetical protein [Gilliamella sp. W8128]
MDFSFKNPVPQNFFGSLSFGRLLFCGCFYTVITSELRGLAPTHFTISRGDYASGHDVTALRLRSLLTLLAKHPCLPCLPHSVVSTLRMSHRKIVFIADFVNVNAIALAGRNDYLTP